VSTVGSHAGTKLKSTSGWNNRSNGSSGNGTDTIGFSAKPGGFRIFDGTFQSVGYNGNWWTATESGSDDAYYWRMDYDGGQVDGSYYYKSYGFSVRCVKDE